MALSATDLSRMAHSIDAPRAAQLTRDFSELFAGDGSELGLAVLLATAHPPFHSVISHTPGHVIEIARSDVRAARTRATHQRDLLGAGPPSEETLRRYAAREKMRIALRELLPQSIGGADVETTARELSDLADATIEGAYQEAFAHFERRFGSPIRADGKPGAFVVLGMGKLGGQELNAGSDVDLIYFYDTDDAEIAPRSGRAAVDVPAPSEFWQRVAKRLTKNLEEITSLGQVWRVDLRLRPDGAAGALVLPVVAVERYYESFGRLWERAALLRARPVAGDLALGESILASLAPFVWRKRIDPSLARELHQLVSRSRIELSSDPDRDLKLGPGGIREAEFFVQTLQLVWGGKDPTVRTRPTLAALKQLEARGLVTEGETDDIAEGYLALRRAEHAVQWTTGVQTHNLPTGDDLERVARILGFRSAHMLLGYLAEHRRKVSHRFASLIPDESGVEDEWGALVVAIEQRDPTLAASAIEKRIARAEPLSEEELARLAASLLSLGAHPDAPLGARTQESFPGFVESLLGSLFDAADPVQAAGFLRAFFARTTQQAVYVRLLASDTAALRRLISLLGSSSFIGDALCNNPDLGDMILFHREVLSEARIRAELDRARDAKPLFDEDPDEALIGALRLAKTRVTLEAAVHDLAGVCEVADINDWLTSLADASLAVSMENARPGSRGLAILAMGKLGGREVSYGSDLDVIFIFDPAVIAEPEDAPYVFAKVARKVIRTISTFHGAGPGYELDARLRPSGNQGLLVTSLDSFAAYHGVGARSGPRAAGWERMALVRARFAAGDPELGARAEALMRSIAFGEPPPREEAALEMSRVRERVLSEMAREREGVFDLKLGRGGILEVEFIAQFLQMLHAWDVPELRVAETKRALVALTEHRILSASDGADLLAAHTFLRRLEQKVRVSRADASHVLDARHSSVEIVARRLDVHDTASHSAGHELIRRLQEHTARVRAIYEATFRTGSA